MFDIKFYFTLFILLNVGVNQRQWKRKLFGIKCMCTTLWQTYPVKQKPFQHCDVHISLNGWHFHLYPIYFQVQSLWWTGPEWHKSCVRCTLWQNYPGKRFPLVLWCQHWRESSAGTSIFVFSQVRNHWPTWLNGLQWQKVWCMHIMAHLPSKVISFSAAMSMLPSMAGTSIFICIPSRFGVIGQLDWLCQNDVTLVHTYLHLWQTYPLRGFPPQCCDVTTPCLGKHFHLQPFFRFGVLGQLNWLAWHNSHTCIFQHEGH